MLKHRPAGALPSDRQRKEVSKGKKQDKALGFSVQVSGKKRSEVGDQRAATARDGRTRGQRTAEA